MQKSFEKNDDGKIEFTEVELKDVLDEVYNNGYQDGKNSIFYWSSVPNYFDSTVTPYPLTASPTAKILCSEEK